MKTALALAAVFALAAPVAGQARTYVHTSVSHASSGGARMAAPRVFAPRVSTMTAGRFAYQQRGRAYANTGRSNRSFDRYGGAFGVGVVTGALAGGYYDSYAPDYAYDTGDYPTYAYGQGAYDQGAYGYDQGYAPDGGANYAYESNASPYVAGSYGAAVQQNYAAQGMEPPTGYGAPAYGQGPAPGAPAYGQGYNCGHWVWDAPIGRYVWAC